MDEILEFNYTISGSNFASAGDATMQIKTELRALGFSSAFVRRISVAMYEGEINMVIHAGGGQARVLVSPEQVEIYLEDHGPGIPDIALAMTEGYSTAPESIRAVGFGAGMGLPNMKRNADEIRIDSKVGVGTTVYMKLNANQ